MKLGNPKANDTPQINLVVDGGLKGTSVKSISPDTNRDDPIAGAALGSLSLLMFPRSLRNTLFQSFVIVCAGIFTRSLLVAVLHPIVWVVTGLVLLTGLMYIIVAMLNHPQCGASALAKTVLFGMGVLLAAIAVF
jgi:hypothetical protein